MCQSAAAIGTNIPPAPYSEALIMLGMCGRYSGLEKEEPAFAGASTAGDSPLMLLLPGSHSFVVSLIATKKWVPV